MSRLIDADKLMKDIIGICKCQPSLEGRQKETVYIKDVIENQPTAYDVDKVVEKLEEKSITFETDFTVKENKWNLTNDAIEIVKRGEIDGNSKDNSSS